MGDVSPIRAPRRGAAVSAEAREAIDTTVRELVILAARRQALTDHLAAMQPKADSP